MKCLSIISVQEVENVVTSLLAGKANCLRTEFKQFARTPER
jgi:hypothetical protein